VPDELTSAQEDELIADLRALRSELAELLGAAHGTEVVELTSAVGRVSRIDAIQQQAMAQEQLRRHEQRAKVVAVALKTVEQGDYGFCKKCGEPIGYGRLKARPETPCCVICMASLGG
jgi:DnaK suppressor protein